MGKRIEGLVLRRVCRAACILALLLSVMVLAPAGARADCVNPAGTAGKAIFNRDVRIPQYCNGTSWIPMLQPRYAPTGVRFDGTNDYLTYNAALSGIADSSTFTGSFWIKYDGFPATMTVLQSATGKVNVFWHNTLHNFQIIVRNSGGSILAQLSCGPTNPAVGQWYHYLISFDVTDPAKRFCYTNDADSLGVIGYNTGTINYATGSPWRIGAATDGPGTTRFAGSMGDIWVDFGTYMDLSVEANRRKFITADGRPVYLGLDGAVPTGMAPEIFMSGNVANWHTNKGTGGGFTVVGSLDEATESPGMAPIGQPPFTPERGNCTSSDGGPLGAAQVFDLTSGNLIGLWYQQNTLFATEYAGGTTAYRWDGATLEFLSNTPKVGAVAEGIWGDGQYIYVGDIGTLSVYSFDGTDLNLIDSVTTNAAESRGVWGDGTYIYVANGGAGISAFSFDGTTLTPVGTPLNTSGFALGVWGDGPYIYLADNNGGLDVYTFDGSTFTLIASDNTHSTSASRVWGKDGDIFVADQNNDVDAYYFNGTTLTWRATIATPGSARGIWSDGTHIFVADTGSGSTSGLRVYTYDGVSFTLVATDNTPGEALAVWGDGTHIFVGDGTYGVRVYSGFACGFGKCMNPERSAGVFVYNGTEHVLQFCDGTEWRALGPVPGPGGIGCNQPTRDEGTLIYSSARGLMQYCDGAAWRGIGYVPDCPFEGDVCRDGTIYAGLSPDGNVPIYVTLDDAPAVAWGPVSDDTVVENCTWSPGTEASCRTGKANSSALAGLGASYAAAAWCESLVANGHSDWYLPAHDELAVIYDNLMEGNTLPANGFQPSTWYWSSSEIDDNSAFALLSDDGLYAAHGKANAYYFRCARHD
jgi:hypothetical protein